MSKAVLSTSPSSVSNRTARINALTNGVVRFFTELTFHGDLGESMERVTLYQQCYERFEERMQAMHR